METIGERILLALKTVNLKQKELAEKLSISEHTLINYIKNRRSISAENLQKIAEICNVSVEWLNTGIGEAPGESYNRILNAVNKHQEVFTSERNNVKLTDKEMELINTIRAIPNCPINLIIAFIKAEFGVK
jgi:transcriptional regulator with XRE-family HTH domain